MPACVTQHASFANSKHVGNNRVAPARRTWQPEPLEEEVEADRLFVDVGEVVLCVAHRDRRFPHGAIAQDDHLRKQIDDRDAQSRHISRVATDGAWLHACKCVTHLVLQLLGLVLAVGLLRHDSRSSTVLGVLQFWGLPFGAHRNASGSF